MAKRTNAAARVGADPGVDSEESVADRPLAGVVVVSIALNLPGPVAVSRLAALGAQATTVQPPTGDPLEAICPGWYAELVREVDVVRLDLKQPDGQAALAYLLNVADLLVTSNRPAALARLGLDWGRLHAAHPRLSQVAIVGHPGSDADVPGHDLTYQAAAGTLSPPAMPTVLVADLAGAERAVGEGLAAVLHRDATGLGCYREVALAVVADDMAEPLRRGLTGGGVLGGALPGYNVYPALAGHVAVAALETHFWRRLTHLLGLDEAGTGLADLLATRPADDWEAWAAEHDLPIAVVRAAPASPP